MPLINAMKESKLFGVVQGRLADFCYLHLQGSLLSCRWR